jgi:two-component system LytT family response regulator
MERFIIIDDKKCEKELAEFLEVNREHIRFNSSLDNLKTSSKAFFEEIASDMGADEKLAVNSNQQIEIVHTRDITHIEAMEQSARLHLADNRYIETNSDIDALGKRLKGSNFIRIHKSYIINLEYFSKLNTGIETSVLLSTGTELPVAEDKKNLLLKYFKELESQI